MQITGKVTSVHSGSGYKDKLRRVTIQTDGSGYLIVTDENLQLDQEVVINISLAPVTDNVRIKEAEEIPF